MTSAITFFIFGLLMGSFMNVCIHRLPAKESIIFPRSYCPSCKNPIPAYDNIPIMSFLFLRGRCRGCKAAISWRYPAVELLNGIGYLLILHHFGPTPATLIYAGFFSALVVITVIDLAHQIIPDMITLPGIPISLLAAGTVLPTGWINSLEGLILGGGLFYLIAWLSLLLLKKEGMGGGDIKLVAMIGALLGWQEVLLAVFAASVSGSIVGLSFIGTRLRSRSDPIPFGPFLVLGALIALFFGNPILDWYFHRP
ncbi:MAG: prepilin peptidase [Nitrospirae bacterium]|nr:prepilin peptidase [Candidatus Troglogloeales bacterium]